MPSFWGDLKGKLEQRKAESLYRERKLLRSKQGAHVVVGNKSVLNFCSNDYLGLASSSELVHALQASAEEYGVGSGASHLVCGHSFEHHQLEVEAASLLGRDKALLFSTGYMANLAILAALFNEKDVIIEDKLNHASMIDGAKLSGSKLMRFRHNNLEHLEGRLKKAKESGARYILVCVDAVFSMDGDIAPLQEIAELAKKYDAILMADDAHGFGVLGETGAGLCESLGLSQEDVPILMCTLGKSAGSFGAVVAGSDELIDALVQFARPYIYTTSMPPAVASASRMALRIFLEQPERRDHLQQLIINFKKQAEECNLPLMSSDTAIQPLLIGDEAQAIKWQKALADKGLWISAIRTPTVAKGKARLRITLTAAHSFDDVDILICALIDVKRKLSVKLK